MVGAGACASRPRTTSAHGYTEVCVCLTKSMLCSSPRTEVSGTSSASPCVKIISYVCRVDDIVIIMTIMRHQPDSTLIRSAAGNTAMKFVMCRPGRRRTAPGFTR